MRAVWLFLLLVLASGLSFEALEEERIALYKIRDTFNEREQQRIQETYSGVVERIAAGRVEAAAILSRLMLDRMTERLQLPNYDGQMNTLRLAIAGNSSSDGVVQQPLYVGGIGEELLFVRQPLVLDVLSAYKEYETTPGAYHPPRPIAFAPYMTVHGLYLEVVDVVPGKHARATITISSGNPVANDTPSTYPHDLEDALNAVKNEEKTWKERAWERPRRS